MQSFNPQALISRQCQAHTSVQSFAEFRSPTILEARAQASPDVYRRSYSLLGDSTSPGQISCRVNVHYYPSRPLAHYNCQSTKNPNQHCCLSQHSMLPMQALPLQYGILLNPIHLCSCFTIANMQLPNQFALLSGQNHQCCRLPSVQQCLQSGSQARQQLHVDCCNHNCENNKRSTNHSELIVSSKNSILDINLDGRLDAPNNNTFLSVDHRATEQKAKDGQEDIMSDFNDRALQYYNAKIYHFRHCYNLLAKLFLNLQIDREELDLSEFEKLVFLYICRRKFTSLSIPVLKDQPLEHEFFEALVAKCKAEPSNKRVEEYTKFILKHTMKHLKDRFKSLNLPANSNGSPPEFYHHYFKEVSETTKMPLEAFHDPLNNRRYKTEIMPKTLNSDYLQLIFRSKSFAKDFRNYISSNQLITDYMKSIPRKFEKILLRWERISEEKIDRKQFRDRLHDYFFKNKQCKLPWTVNEIAAGINYFLSIMQTLQTYR